MDQQSDPTDEFLNSMTFTNVQRNRCDCDECLVMPRAIPRPIVQAIQQHNKQRKLTRTQDRRLIRRIDQVVLYEYTMPIDAEPLVEFGNNHRIVYIDRLEEHATIKSIGTGVIGSADEESKRKTLPWKSKQAYLVPSNDGKAIGFIHTLKEGSTSSPAVIKVFKLPDETPETESESTNLLYVILESALETPTESISQEDTERIKTLIHEFEQDP